jgi:menaquinone-dependent protoporphyrinogen IX oxidase
MALLFGVGTTVSGQTTPSTVPPQPVPPQYDNDTTRRELASMDRFLDSHPELSEQLRKDPSLINNQEWVNNHPALQEYLQNHQEVREELKENPSAFMRQENRYDQREERREGDRDTTRRELAGMDRFLDSHPEVSEQLRKDPSLINNREWVDKHPALQEYLQTHPGIREEFKENPSAFMQQENRYDQREERREGDRDTTHRELASMDRFLDGHPELSEQLHKDPSLINNREWVDKHPALQEYLQTHPGVREEIKENPSAFMQQENRYDQHEGDRDLARNNQIGTGVRDDRNRLGGRDDHGELTSFGQFLGGHSTVAQQLSKDPSLANNKEYLASHPQLGEYLKTHPAMTQQLATNPQAVMSSNWVQQGTSAGATKASTPTPKPKTNPMQ